MTRKIGCLLLVGGMLLACGDDDVLEDGPAGAPDQRSLLSEPLFGTDAGRLERVRPAPDPLRRAYFGDLHVHTTLSLDAYSMGTLASPSDAYRFARGEAIPHPAGFDLQLQRPLDFYAVTDHAMFLGVAAAAGDTSTEVSKVSAAEPLHDLNHADNMGLMSVLGRLGVFGQFLPSFVSSVRDGEIEREAVLDVTRGAWKEIVDAADHAYEPGRFTTFVGYEYTTWSGDLENLHRNVIFRESDRLPAVPYSRLHSENPEDLWAWMDDLRADGIESLAIPHNSNGSNGQMFKLVDFAGNPIDGAYAERRIRNEPLVEITQIKGTSETHPKLSTRDEWADFEIMKTRVASNLESQPAGSYARDALRRGLSLEREGIPNPYAFGVIGSSDTHTGAAENDESNFASKLGLLTATPMLRGSVPVPWWLNAVASVAAPAALDEVDGSVYIQTPNTSFGASGLAVAWAEENTREAIYDALRRRETYATSGPRIQLRFFAGYDFPDSLAADRDGVARAYAGGVPMGTDLPERPGSAPRFLVLAGADPEAAPLQRLQVVKGWIDAEGETDERVYDVACSGGAAVDPDTHRCPDNGASVDLADCSTSGEGAAELRTVWQDPDHVPGQRAFYYARVLENPTCRWSTWDALREGVAPRADLAATLQERAWSSPIHVGRGD